MKPENGSPYRTSVVLHEWLYPDVMTPNPQYPQYSPTGDVGLIDILFIYTRYITFPGGGAMIRVQKLKLTNIRFVNILSSFICSLQMRVINFSEQNIFSTHTNKTRTPQAADLNQSLSGIVKEGNKQTKKLQSVFSAATCRTPVFNSNTDTRGLHHGHHNVNTH